MQYTALDGTAAEGEVWSPGPLHGSVWLLRHPDRQPVVVHVAKGRQLDYTPPPPPPRPFAREVVERAEDIRRRHIEHGRRFRSRPPSGPKPTPAEVEAAQAVVDIERARELLEKQYREHHGASSPIAVKRVLELAGIELPKKTRARKGATADD